jgi:hypothetical protein
VAQDLAVEILSPSPTFHFTMPVITPTWDLSLSSGATSPCAYDRAHNRYCPPLKTIAESSSTSETVHPTMAFTASGDCQAGDGTVDVVVEVFAYTNSTKHTDALRHLDVSVPCAGGKFEATTSAFKYAGAPWVVATVTNSRSGKYGPLMNVQLAVTYDAH